MVLGVVTRAGSARTDRKSTRLNSSHDQISYAVFCLKKKKNENRTKDVSHGWWKFPYAAPRIVSVSPSKHSVLKAPCASKAVRRVAAPGLRARSQVD